MNAKIYNGGNKNMCSSELQGKNKIILFVTA